MMMYNCFATNNVAVIRRQQIFLNRHMLHSKTCLSNVEIITKQNFTHLMKFVFFDRQTDIRLNKQINNLGHIHG